VLVSVSEVAWHRTRELRLTGWFEDCARNPELLADFIRVSDDLSDDPGHPALTADPGVRYPSVREPGSGLERDARLFDHRDGV